MKQDTQLKILEEAQLCLQMKGYNGFSYKDLSKAIGIKTSSIHYHYPTKVDLVIAVIDFYLDGLTTELERISRIKASSNEKFKELINVIFLKTFFDDRKMCLGGILAAEVFDLDPKIRAKLKAFFAKIELWIVSVLEEESNSKVVNLRTDPKMFAKQLIIQIEGALILARLFDDDKFLSTINNFISLH